MATASSAKAWVIGKIKNNTQSAQYVKIKNEAGKKMPALILTQDLMDKLQHACVTYQLMQAHNERKAKEATEEIPAARTTIPMLMRCMFEDNAKLYQSGGDTAALDAHNEDICYLGEALRKHEQAPIDRIDEGAVIQEQQVEACGRFLPELYKAFEKANLVKRAGPQDTQAPPLIEPRLANLLAIKLPFRYNETEAETKSSPDDGSKNQEADAKSDEARHEIPSGNVDAVFDRVMSSCKKHRAVLDEYVLRLEAVGIDCPTGEDSAHAEDRFREYFEARKKVINFLEDQENARSDFGSWYTINHGDEEELLQDYTDTADKLRAELVLIGVEVPKLEEECDKQGMYMRMIQSHHHMRVLKENHVNLLLKGKSDDEYDDYEDFAWPIHKAEEKIAKFKLRKLEARKYLEQRGVDVPPAEAFELPESSKLKSDFENGDGGDSIRVRRRASMRRIDRAQLY